LDKYDWCLFTSVNGVKYFRRRLEKLGKDVRALAKIKIGVIGEKTASALWEWGLRADLMPLEFRAEALAEALKEKGVAGKKMLLARAEKARDILPEMLKASGAEVDIVPVYRTILPKANKDEFKKLLDQGIDIITFTSSSTVKHLVEIFYPEPLARLTEGINIACIGPITAQIAKEFGLNVTIIPKVYTIRGLVKAIVAFSQSQVH
jgi:uroporphyrinogen III methyltransferase/synthase